MKVSYLAIKALNPCTDRFNNFVYHYPKFEGSREEFLGLENITYQDKIWVMTRFLPKQVLIRWALACAYSVAYIFNERYPNKPEVNNLLHYMTTLDLDNISDDQKQELMKLRFDSAAAAYAAADAAAYAAYAAYAAAAAAAAAASAYAAGDYSDAAAYAASAAAAAAAAAYVTKETREELNLLLLNDICFACIASIEAKIKEFEK